MILRPVEVLSGLDSRLRGNDVVVSPALGKEFGATEFFRESFARHGKMTLRFG